jgi:hypothetical protein
MKNRYTVLGRTAHKTDETERSLGSSFGKVRMIILVSFLSLLSGFNLNAQITTTTWNFNANSTGWSGNIARSTATNATMCGTPGMRRNLYSGATTGNLVSPQLPGTNNQGQITLTYKYKAANFGSPFGAANPWGTFNVQVGNSATGPWTTVSAVSQETQTGSCITKTVTFFPPSGNLFLKWDCFWTNGDYYLSFDDISVSQAAAVSCSGTPNAGTAAISSSSGCAPGTVALSATGISAGLGFTYQWQSGTSATGPWANIAGATSASYNATTTTGTTFYKLVTTCTSSGTPNSSNAVSFVGTACASNSVPATGSNVVACGTNTYLYDNGGAAGNYVSNSNGYTVLDNSGSGVVTISGSFSYVESTWDFLRIYSGIGTGGTLLATYSNTAGGTIAPYSSAPGTPITVQFTSDGSGEGGGFAMQVLYSGACAPPCVPTGNETSYGAGSWIGYVYNAATAGAFTTYKGIVTEATTFNRTHTSIAAGATAPHCSLNSDLFTIRYKNTTNFPAAYYTFSVGGDDGVRFSIDGGATWLINNWVDQGYTVSSNPTPIFLSGNVNMVFEYYENSGGAQSSFSYVSAPACSGTPTPGNTVASATSVTTGGTTNLSLQNATTGGGVTYQWQSSTSSTGPWTSIGGATLPTYTATVTANTWYQCIVTCTASAATAVSSPVQITLTYCIPTITTIGDYISAFSTTGGFTNVSTSGTSTAAYENYTAQVVSQSSGSVVNFSGSYVGGFAGFSIWVDWNNNLVFDAAELMYNAPATAATWTGSFTVPVGQAVGNYRMRIRAAWNALSPPACGNTSYGQTEDYTFTVSAPPACIAPTALTSSAITSTSATISWTAASPAPASGYQYYFSTSATVPTAGTTASGTTAPGVTTANLSSLTANTTYYFWVRSNCGGTGTSTWAGSSSFYTGYCVPSALYTGTYFSNFVTTGGVTNISNNTNAISASGYGVFTSQSVSQYAGSTVGFQATIVGGTAGIAVFVDWNNDLDFADAGETVYSSNAYQFTGTTTSSFVVPAAAGAGNYRMRIVTDYNATNPAPCTLAFGQGEIEDYTISVVALTPCAGTPNPGATTATSSQVFAGGSTTLGITTAQTGTGISYQWQSSPTGSAPWTSIGGANSSTYLASPTAATYYQCVVTCSNGGATGTSTPILISVNPYCEPIYTIGKTDGDLISNISIAGTTLSNNSGTAQTNPAYTFFTGQPYYTCDLVAANSYTVNVTVGTWGSQGIAAWIDYNDNNVFEASEKIGSTLTTIGTGTGGTPIPANHTASFTINLSCTPPLGLHRMRVRDVYFTNGPTIDPCATYAYGETEDYMVNVISGPAFTPTFTSTPAATSCVGTTVNYVANAGQTNYAWTFAGTAGTDYTVLSGGTSASNTATVTWNTGGAHSMTMNYASPLGCASAGAVSNTVTMPTTGSDISDNEAATCAVNQDGWVHFYNLSTGKLVVSINSQGQNLGDVAVTSFVDGANALVPACTNPNPIYSTSVMQRHWVITPTIQPTTPVLVRFPFSDTELDALNFAAFNNVNGNDDISSVADIKLSRYSNGSAANVNGSASDNCGSGTSSIHAQVATGTGTLSSVYPQIASAGQYVTFSIPGFSEFWLHGSATSSPLPVELMNFQANCAGEGKVAVTWATASEHNSANFTIEKSRDGINWSVLTTVAGAGNSTQMINYSTVDNTASAGVNYYRLTQTDFDGASETFNIASANCGDNSTTTTVKVYPNPSAGDFYIDFTSEEIIGSSVISITDARGMEVYKMNVTVEKGNNVFHIENMDVAPGMYYIKVSNGTTTSSIVKHSLR